MIAAGNHSITSPVYGILRRVKPCMFQITLLTLLLSALFVPVKAHAQTPGAHTLPVVEQALLIDHGDRSELILSFSVPAAAESVVMVLTPGTPAATTFPNGADLFAYLAEATRPVTQVEARYIIGLPPLSAATPTVTPSAQRSPAAGSLSLTTFASVDAGSLSDWLAANRFTLTSAEQATLQSHTTAGGSVVALAFVGPLPGGTLPALQISYPAVGVAYPHILGVAVAPVDLFVLADAQRAAADLELYYAGPTAELNPVPPADVRSLLRSASYLTHLHGSANPAPSAVGILLQPAPAAAPFRRTRIVREDVYLFERSSTIIGLGLVACTSLLALAGAVAMRRRLDAINPDS